jgi:predicted GIY-YIG superfamily endonuclease
VAVYLLHFEEPVYGTSRHYVGFTTNLDQRLAMHRAGHGARITSIARKKGIAWELAFVWEEGDKVFERLIKKKGTFKRFCKFCTPPPDPDQPAKPARRKAKETPPANVEQPAKGARPRTKKTPPQEL